jgi:hypothetical protein
MQQTSAKANDIIDEIVEALTIASDQTVGGLANNQTRLFEKNLRIKTVEAVLAELHDGYMESYAFERLV